MSSCKDLLERISRLFETNYYDITAFSYYFVGVNPSKALVMSQVVLSFGIAFALVPLIMFTSNKKIMGNLVNHRITTIIAWIIAGIIIGLNIFLLYQTVFG